MTSRAKDYNYRIRQMPFPALMKEIKKVKFILGTEDKGYERYLHVKKRAAAYQLSAILRYLNSLPQAW